MNDIIADSSPPTPTGLPSMSTDSLLRDMFRVSTNVTISVCRLGIALRHSNAIMADSARLNECEAANTAPLMTRIATPTNARALCVESMIRRWLRPRYLISEGFEIRLTLVFSCSSALRNRQLQAPKLFFI